MARGIRLYKLKRYDQALQEFLDLGLNSTENPEYSYYLGLCYTKLGKFDEALVYLEQVVTTHINLLHIYQSRMILSYIYTMTRRYRLAEFEIRQLIESGYESAQVYSAYGYIAYKLGRTDEAVEFLEKAIRLDPRNPNALNSLGYLLAESGRDLDRAQDLIQKALHMKPDNPIYLDSLGWALYKQGKLRESREYLRKALDLMGGNREIAEHMRAAMAPEGRKS